MSRSPAVPTIHRPQRSLFRGLACVLALAVAAPAAAATYKWIDEHGVIHYTDKIPPEAVNRGAVEITKEGVPVRKVDPALTPEQRRARQQEDERKRAADRAQEEAARKDRALLASYATEGEIDLARDRTLRTIDAAIQSSISYSEQLAKRKAVTDQKIAAYKDKQPPAVLEREAETLDEELGKQAELVNAKRTERAAVTAKYEADKARYRELLARIAAANGGADAKVVAAPSPTSSSSPAAAPAPAPSTARK